MAPPRRAQTALNAVEHDQGPWGYLTKATAAVRPHIKMEVIEEVFPHGRLISFLKDEWAKYLETYDCVATEDEVDPEDWSRPVVLEYYPEEAHECLSQVNYVGGADADILALWMREDRTSICHAHMEGFWILGEDSVDLIEKYADELEAKFAEAT